MRKIRKLINSIALLMAPSVAFSAITNEQFVDFLSKENMRDENDVFTMQAIVGAGLFLINEGEGSEDELVKKLREIFIDILDTTSFSDRISFVELRKLAKNFDIVSDFINQVANLNNLNLCFSALQHQLFYNQFVTAFNEGRLNNLIAQMDDTALHNIKVLINYFKRQEFINDIDNPNVDVYEHPEVMFFRLVCDGDYVLTSWAQLCYEKCQNDPVCDAFKWIHSEAGVKDITMLRVLLVNPGLAKEFLPIVKARKFFYRIGKFVNEELEEKVLEAESKEFFDRMGKFVDEELEEEILEKVKELFERVEKLGDEELLSEKHKAVLEREVSKIKEDHREDENALPKEQNEEQSTLHADVPQQVNSLLPEMETWQESKSEGETAEHAALEMKSDEVKEDHRENENVLPEEQNKPRKSFLEEVDAALDKIMNYQLKDFPSKK